MIKTAILLLVTAQLIACSSTKTSPVETIPPVEKLFNHAAFEHQPTIDEHDIFSLPKQEQHKFLTYYNAELNKGIRPDRAVLNYLEQRLDRFTFDGATLTARESLEKNEGNCISLAILTQAYASLAKIETTFREVGTVPVFRKNNNTILISNHFRTKLLAPSSSNAANQFEIIRAGTVVDYFPAQDSFFIDTASYDDLVAKYYANKAVDSLLDKNFNNSYSFLISALNYSPNDAELINVAAVLHRRRGLQNDALEIFKFADKHHLTSQNLISNYLSLAKTQEDTQLVNHLENLLDNSVSTPFDKIQLAQRSIRKGSYNKAIRELKEIIVETPYIPEPYFELARIYYTKGDIENTERLLALAIEKSSDPQKRSLFQAKRDAISKRKH
ncbi:tetratricopeptide repeat protein [Pseudoalteromonas luteoviolacea]|uniref:Uncharacterized protein n=1 Tax=Pseudoalteromonas luteoviolacea (strain 2ta16) TaxID=1353533 RepID=V4HNW2_PSEL2|nr:hypothetical protein [Pseudoalteromonas luteoviolacea]ESP91453.1 hypothetical protein PL2TA16_00252 [Pseudoalteromonas luteoviolacea 2ta16]KZN40103.1 hypothetical protein N483_18110 [Pseudoalteromonas luteoviolacea NCIMB 1944]